MTTSIPENVTFVPIGEPKLICRKTRKISSLVSDYETWLISGKMVEGMNVLGVVIFSIIFGNQSLILDVES